MQYVVLHLCPHKKYATQKQNLHLLEHNVRQNASEVYVGSATQKEEASGNKRRQQGRDTGGVSDGCCFFGKYGKKSRQMICICSDKPKQDIERI